MVAISICSDFGAQEKKPATVSIVSPSIFAMSDGTLKECFVIQNILPGLLQAGPGILADAAVQEPQWSLRGQRLSLQFPCRWCLGLPACW